MSWRPREPGTETDASVEPSVRIAYGARMLLGRRAEIDALGGVIDALGGVIDTTARGRAAFALVVGDAGVGKSALLAVAAQLAAERGATVLRAYCDPFGGGRPFGPLLDLLGSGTALSDLYGRVRAMLATTAGRADVLGSGLEIGSLISEELVAGFEQLAVAGHTVLLIDDLHWVDRPTAQTIVALARRLTDLPLLVIGAARPDLAGLEIIESARRQLGHDDPPTIVELGPLGERDGRLLAVERLRAEPGRDLNLLLARCAGNPLLLTELVAALVEGGHLHFDGDSVDLAPSADTRRLPATGDLDRAAELLDAGDRLMEQFGLQFGADWLLQARVLLLEAEERPTEAIALAETLWAAYGDLSASASMALLGPDLVRLAMRSGAVELAGRVVTTLITVADEAGDDPTIQGRVRRARGLFEHRPQLLLDAAMPLSSSGRGLEAALAVAEAGELLAEHDHEAAIDALEGALGTLEDLGAHAEAERVRARLTRLRPPRLGRPRGRRPAFGWEALTATEWLVVHEVAGGASNGAVAELLNISRRTVEAHLRSVYTKLDISTRVQLALAYTSRDEPLADWVTETGDCRARVLDAGNEVLIAEVGVPTERVDDATILVDLPGAGGLGSLSGALTLAAAAHAHAVAFVTDAGRPLTADERTFVADLARRCPRVAVVESRIDLHPGWREVLDHDTGVTADLVDHCVAVSAELAHREGVDRADGIATLHGWLGAVAFAARRRDSLQLAAYATHVGRELRVPLEAVLAASSGEDPSGLLDELRGEHQRLRNAAGRWGQVLSDSFADLAADADHQLRQQLRDVIRRGEEQFATLDPARAWNDVAPRLRRDVRDVATSHLEMLDRRIGDTARTLAELLDGDTAAAEVLYGQLLTAALEADDGPGLADRELAIGDLPRSGIGGKSLTLLRSSYSGALMVGFLSSVIGLSVAAPAVLTVGAILGSRGVRQESSRQLEQRRQLAANAVRRHADEVATALGKESRDRIRRAQRALRDTMGAHVPSRVRTAADALAFAEHAAAEAASERSARRDVLTRELHRVEVLLATARDAQDALCEEAR